MRRTTEMNLDYPATGVKCFSCLLKIQITYP